MNGLGADGADQPRLKNRGWAETLLTHFAQQISHGHGDIAKIDVDRTRAGTFMAQGAMVGDIFKFLPMLDGHAAAGLLFVKKGLNQQRGCQYFVAGAVKQIGAWHMGGTHRLAFATAQAVFDGV